MNPMECIITPNKYYYLKTIEEFKLKLNIEGAPNILQTIHVSSSE